MGKKFLFFIGKGKYTETEYMYPALTEGGNLSFKTVGKKTNLTPLAILMGLTEFDGIKWDPEKDRIIACVTAESRKAWEGENNFAGAIHDYLRGKGYADGEIEKMVTEMEIPNMQTEEDISMLYAKFTENIEEKDEIYIDITHSFRIIPFIVYNVIEFLKVLKKIRPKRIFYGVFDPEKEINTIIDIAWLTVISDLTEAVYVFERYGVYSAVSEIVRKKKDEIYTAAESEDENKKFLAKLSKIVGKMDALFNNINVCRLTELKGNEPDEISELIKKMTPVNSGVMTIITSLMNSVGGRIENLYLEGLPTSEENNALPWSFYCGILRWCIEKGLIQQAFTYLRELIITRIMEILGYKPEEIINQNKRQEIEKLLGVIQEYNKAGVNLPIRKRFVEYLKLYSAIIEYRNDINHAGYRKNPRSYKKFINSISGLYGAFIKTLREDLRDKEGVNSIMEERPRKMAVIMNHPLNPDQIRDAERLVDEIKYPDEELRAKWRNFPPEADIEEIRRILHPFREWLLTNFLPGDYLFVQGEHGATMMMVSFAYKIGMIPIYATTVREVVETVENGITVKKALFRHVRFRRYVI